GRVAGVADAGRVVDADTHLARTTGARVRRRAGGEQPAEAPTLVEVRVVDRPLRAEPQPALPVTVVAPPDERAAPLETVPRTEVADVAVDQRAGLDGVAGAGAADHGSALEGGLERALGR